MKLLQRSSEIFSVHHSQPLTLETQQRLYASNHPTVKLPNPIKNISYMQVPPLEMADPWKQGNT